MADDDGSFPVPLQLEKVFNGQEDLSNDEWKNMIVFGVYSDPPFATSDDFQSRDGAKAYADKKKGAEFIEYFRKRLIVAKEILSVDGS